MFQCLKIKNSLCAVEIYRVYKEKENSEIPQKNRTFRNKIQKKSFVVSKDLSYGAIVKWPQAQLGPQSGFFKIKTLLFLSWIIVESDSFIQTSLCDFGPKRLFGPKWSKVDFLSRYHPPYFERIH